MARASWSTWKTSGQPRRKRGVGCSCVAAADRALRPSLEDFDMKALLAMVLAASSASCKLGALASVRLS